MTHIYLGNMFGVEPIMIVLLVVVLLFGGTKIPELMRGVGRGMGELQKGLHEGKMHLEESMKEVTSSPITTTATTGSTTAADEPQIKPAEDAMPRS